MRIAEIFESPQGEGRFAGTPSVFLRTTGCNLRCWFCDTPYTSWQPEGWHQPWQSVVEQLLAPDREHIVITGGEPLLQPEIVPLTRALSAAGRYITIETAATVFRPVAAALLSISPKLANSTPFANGWTNRHEQLRNQPEVVRQMIDRYEHQFKFVIDHPEDVSDVLDYLECFPRIASDRVWLMPQATDADTLRRKSQWLADIAARYGFRCSPRLHIEEFGNVRGR